MKGKVKGVKKRRFSKPFIILTIVIQLLLSGYLSLLLVFYSPFFGTIKRFIVCSAMESRTKQSIARMFLSDTQISEITGGTSQNNQQQKISTVKTKNTGDTGINAYKVSGKQFSGYVLEVNDPLRVKVAMTKYVGKVGEFTSKIAERLDAVGAINGGGFDGGVGWSDSAKYPTNFVMHNGDVIWKNETWSNTDKVNVIALDKKGVLVVGNHSINELQRLNVSEAVTLPKNSQNDFRPLIVNGTPQFKEGTSESRAPRTAIAQKSDGTILMIVLDGRQVGQFG
ncbi:MAG TPA: phosphodiester glycosidase family protein, partial [Ruminiclostridium sp.]|nr:phosphodiester glycosidase family protein [Ruminiclostridium sp.]